MIALELFGCAGGMALGFQRAGIEFDLVIDKDPNACDSYERNIGRRPIEIDVKDLLRMLPILGPTAPIDLLVADPPCTPWSRAGKRKGLDDKRDMLRQTVSLIRALRPRCWLIGNVPGLDDGPNWPIVQQVIGSLSSAGYCVDYAKLDAADYGVPQHRIRPFWFGHPPGMCLRWPQPTHGDPRTLGHATLGDHRQPWVTCRQALGHLSLEDMGQPIRVRWKSNTDHRASDPDEPAKTQTSNTHTDGALLAHQKHPINDPDAPSFTIDTKADRGAQGATVCAWPWDRPATTVQADPRIAPPGHHGKSFLSDNRGRGPNAVRLSERARAILQGFPEQVVFCGDTKVSRAAQIGMAMPPGLAEAVARSIARWFEAQQPPTNIPQRAADLRDPGQPVATENPSGFNKTESLRFDDTAFHVGDARSNRAGDASNIQELEEGESETPGSSHEYPTRNSTRGGVR